MMSSILEKTIQQTMLIMRGPEAVSVSSCLQTLEDCIMGMSRTLDRQQARKTVSEIQRILTNKCQDMKMSVSERRHCILMIIHLANSNETLPSVYPFVIKFIVDAATVLDKLLGHVALRSLCTKRTPDVYIAVGTLQKDISSKKPAVVFIALTTLANVMDLDLVPVFLPYINKIIHKGSNSMLRCKAVIVLEVMQSVGSQYVPDIWDMALRAVCDQDPHVMSASLPLLCNLVKKSLPPDNAKICEKLIFILQQMLNGRLPLDMMHNGICAPWDFIRIMGMIRNLPSQLLSEHSVDELSKIVQLTLSRMQVCSNIQVAIVSECIQVISYFHSKLHTLDKFAIDAIDNVLSSQNPNIRHCAIEMVKCMKQRKPGVSRLYKDALMNLLSDSNSGAFHAAVELLEDLTSTDNCEELITMLVEKLDDNKSTDFKKQIIHGILRIIECDSGDGQNSDWLLANFHSLLRPLRTEIDFSLVQKIASCTKKASFEIQTKTVKDLLSQLDENVGYPMLYCTMLEILSTFCKDISRKDCENAVEKILENTHCQHWGSHTENVMIYSWRVVMELAGYHNVNVDIGELSNDWRQSFSVGLQMQYVEMKYLFSESECMQMFVTGHDETADVRESLTNLKLNLRENCSTQSADDSVFNEPKSRPTFKTQRYSKSRFAADETHHEYKPKKTFLNSQSSKPTPTVVWDSKKYNLHKDAGHSDNDMS